MRSRNYDDSVGQISEMAIVDTFTRLIFADEGELSPQEELIIGALRAVDANVLRDSRSEMGDYLRALGVREMIHLVSRIREYILGEVEVAMTGSTDSSSHNFGMGRHTSH